MEVVKERRFAKVLEVIVMILMIPSMTMGIYGFILTRTAINPAVIKQKVLTDEVMDAASDGINEIVIDSLNLSDNEVDGDIVDPEFVETVVNNAVDVLVFGRYIVDTEYYSNYINNELIPKLEKTTGKTFSDEDKSGLNEKIVDFATKIGSSVVFRGVVRLINNPFRKIVGIMLACSIVSFALACQIHMIMFFVFRNEFIPIKNFMLNSFISFGINAVVFSITQLISNSIVKNLDGKVDEFWYRFCESILKDFYNKPILILWIITIALFIGFLVAVKLMRKQVFVVNRPDRAESKARKANKKELKRQEKEEQKRKAEAVKAAIRRQKQQAAEARIAAQNAKTIEGDKKDDQNG